MIKREDIQIRDPFILKDESSKLYYLYGTTDKNPWYGLAEGFDVYISDDLEVWEGPHAAFRPEPNFWADMNFWAPEVHLYNGKYYMLASFKKEGRARGTQILVSDNAMGPFRPHSERPVTPDEWESLDGTLYIDRDNQPWMVFCHEWMQIGNGTIAAIKLSESLKFAIGEPITLFSATDAPWVTKMPLPEEALALYPDASYYVTDGPFMYRCQNGALLMLWSSFKNENYALGIAVSQSGEVTGPWIQEDSPVFEGDGGHGMIFKTFDETIRLAVHSPNDSPNERLNYIDLEEHNGKLTVTK